MGNRNSAVAQPSQSIPPASTIPPYSLSENDDFCDDQPLSRLDQTPTEPISSKADLKVELTGCYPQVQISTKAQELPFILSLSSPGIEEEKGVDLVCVVDGSGSMRGKLDPLKSSLRLLVDKLTEKDRVALFSCNSYANYICPLTVCNAAGKATLHTKIDSLSAKGSLNLVTGLHYAFEVLKNRRQRNPLSALFYLTSGRDERTGACLRVREELALCGDMVCGGPVELHTFGYGEGYDKEVMTTMVAGRSGHCHFVGNLPSLGQTFASCLERLKVTFADSIAVELQPCDQAILWQTFPSAQESVLTVDNLLANDQKNVLFTLNFPTSPRNLLPNCQFPLISAKVTYRLISTDEIRSQEVEFRISLISEAEITGISANETALIRFYQLKAEEILKTAEKDNFQLRLQLKSDFLAEIQSSSIANSLQIAVLKTDFELSMAQIVQKSPK